MLSDNMIFNLIPVGWLIFIFGSSYILLFLGRHSTEQPYIRNEFINITCHVTSMKTSQKSYGFGLTVHHDGEEPYETGCIYMSTPRGAYIAPQYVTETEPTQEQCYVFYTSLLERNASTLQVTIKLTTTGTYQCVGWTEDTLIPFGLEVSILNLQGEN